MSLADRLRASTAPAPGAVQSPQPNHQQPVAATRQRARAPARRSDRKPRRRERSQRRTDGGDDGDGDGAELPPHAATVATLRKAQVCAALNVSPWTLDRWLRAGKFPPPLYLTVDSNVGLWKLSTIESFLEQRRRARRKPPKRRGMFLRSRKRARSRQVSS
jgi:predicted DNA-binding transcriptional regulator AlpA